jgi:hypothetical protein
MQKQKGCLACRITCTTVVSVVNSDIFGRFSSAVTDYSQQWPAFGNNHIELLVHEVVPWFHMANIGCHKRNFKFGHPSCKSWLRPWSEGWQRALNRFNQFMIYMYSHGYGHCYNFNAIFLSCIGTFKTDTTQFPSCL